MSEYLPAQPLRLLTVNIHKGYNAFNRRFVLHELREAVRAVRSDLVFLQEVEGASGSAGAVDVGAQYEFLADQIWPDHAYGRNAVAEGQDHGNAVLSRFPIVRSYNHDVSLPGAEPLPLATIRSAASRRATKRPSASRACSTKAARRGGSPASVAGATGAGAAGAGLPTIRSAGLRASEGKFVVSALQAARVTIKAAANRPVRARFIGQP